MTLPSPPLLEGVGFSPTVLDRHGTLLRMGLTDDEKYRVFTPLAEVSPQLVQAVLLYEDRHFYQHPGVNPLAMARAELSMLGGSRRMGGSTLTMQVVRLRLGLDTSTLRGKLVQMFRAVQVEWHHDKRAILEAYFNLAPYGGNVEGVGAAARLYFHRDARRLTLSESLALAVVPQNPGKRSPLNGSGLAEARATMHRLWAERAGHAAELVVPMPLRVHGPASLPFAAPHATTEVLEQAARAAAHAGAAQGSARARPAPGAGRHVTTLDAPLQAFLEARLREFTVRGRPWRVRNAAALLLHWPSMEIRALAGSANFHDARIAGQVDGTRARRSPGSTLKPFIYGLALDQGLIHPQTLLLDTPRSFGGYDPENFDRLYRGPLPAHEALRASRNIPAIWLAARLSPDLFTLLRRAGVGFTQDAEHYGLSLVLGGAEVTMRELAGLYAMLANGGVWRPARLRQDEVDNASTEQSVPLLSPEAAHVTLRMLEDPNRTLRTAGGEVPLRFKTGTSNGFRDAWTVGVAGPYVLAVWVGNFDNTANPLFVGGEVAAPLYLDLVRALGQRIDLADRVPAQEAGLGLVRLPVCVETGDTDTTLCAQTVPTWFIPGKSPSRPSGIYRTIWVDEATGLRACEPSSGTREEVWAFWPSDLRALFARAGIAKPVPPPFLPQCTAQDGGGGPAVPGASPRIRVPKEGVRYQRRVHDDARNTMPLSASADADATTLFWFAGETFLGTSAPDAPLMWRPESGHHVIRVLDDRGRATVRRMVVDTVP